MKKMLSKLIRGKRLRKNQEILIILVLLSIITFLYLNCEYNCGKKTSQRSFRVSETKYDQNLPIIFIGGVPRSGTTLMRVMLDAHPLINCGEETRILPRLLDMRNSWRTPKEVERLNHGGITEEIIDSAVASFMLEIIVRHNKPTEYFCDKDPYLLKTTNYISDLFPKSKFILMIRDARSTIHSIVSRNITIDDFRRSNYSQMFIKWNELLGTMYTQCLNLGPERCLPVYYEKLVSKPEIEMRKVLSFLNITWNDAVLHHENYIGEKIKISPSERSSDQVIKPINFDGLNTWIGKIPQDVLNDLDKLAPLLRILGYNH